MNRDHLVISAEGQEPLSVPLVHSEGPTQEVSLFEKLTPAIHLSNEFDEWCSEALKTPVQLVRRQRLRTGGSLFS